MLKLKSELKLSSMYEYVNLLQYNTFDQSISYIVEMDVIEKCSLPHFFKLPD